MTCMYQNYSIRTYTQLSFISKTSTTIILLVLRPPEVVLPGGVLWTYYMASYYLLTLISLHSPFDVLLWPLQTASTQNKALLPVCTSTVVQWVYNMSRQARWFCSSAQWVKLCQKSAIFLWETSWVLRFHCRLFFRKKGQGQNLSGSKWTVVCDIILEFLDMYLC